MKLKFNLNFGGEQVRTIEDVRTQAINTREIMSEIIKTFQENEETDPAYVEVDFSLFNYFDGGNKFRADFKPDQLPEKLDESLHQVSAKVIHEYGKGYDTLVQDIIVHSDDLTYIYDRFDEMTNNYSNEIALNSMNLFERFCKEAPLAAFALFGHCKMRQIFQNTTQILDKLRFFMSKNDRSGELYCNYENITIKLQKLVDNKYKIKVYQSVAYTPNWCNAKTGKRYLLIYGQSDGTFPPALVSASSLDGRKHAIRVSQIASQLPIFNGIDYQCFGPNDRFYYMEAR